MAGTNVLIEILPTGCFVFLQLLGLRIYPGSVDSEPYHQWYEVNKYEQRNPFMPYPSPSPMSSPIPLPVYVFLWMRCTKSCCLKGERTFFFLKRKHDDQARGWYELFFFFWKSMQVLTSCVEFFLLKFWCNLILQLHQRHSQWTWQVVTRAQQQSKAKRSISRQRFRRPVSSVLKCGQAVEYVMHHASCLRSWQTSIRPRTAESEKKKREYKHKLSVSLRQEHDLNINGMMTQIELEIRNEMEFIFVRTTYYQRSSRSCVSERCTNCNSEKRHSWRRLCSILGRFLITSKNYKCASNMQESRFNNVKIFSIVWSQPHSSPLETPAMAFSMPVSCSSSRSRKIKHFPMAALIRLI